MSTRRETNREAISIETPLSRRALLRGGLTGAAGLLALGNTNLRALAGPRPAKAKSVIQIWMWGGPCHLDTFDPKPEAGEDYCGPLRAPIDTNADGIRIGELLPQLAKQADKYSIIRSMTHGINGHETASYTVQTGRQSGGRVVYPCVGAVTSLFKGRDAGFEGLIPPYVVLTQPQGRFSEAGFLGPRYKPFATGGDPGKDPFAVEGVVAPGISKKRQKARRELLWKLNSLRRELEGDARMAELDKSEEAAYDLILGKAGEIFDLSTEDSELRGEYGRNTFGQSCLMARRLVEIWIMERDEEGWSEPWFELPGMYVTTARDGTLYLTDIEGEESGIVRHEPLEDGGGYGEAERLVGGVNSPTPGWHPCIASDESFIVFDSERPGGQGGEGDFYVCFRQDDGSWGPAINLGDEINTDGGNMCASLSPDGKYLFYHSRADIWWVSTEAIERLRPE